jgi:hypothetical protein
MRNINSWWSTVEGSRKKRFNTEDTESESTEGTEKKNPPARMPALLNEEGVNCI